MAFSSVHSHLTDREIRELLCELCRGFYQLGWVSGTGGGISIRKDERIFVAPSGVQKERLQPQDLFVIDSEGNLLESPAGMKISACTPLFLHAYQQRNAGAVIHSHSIHAMLSTLLYSQTFSISNLEMLKGIRGKGAFDTLEVPIIENTAHEEDLSDSLAQSIQEHPDTFATLVRSHGVYVWGETWMEAKTHAEVYDYLFQTAVELHRLGMNPFTSSFQGK